MTRKAHDQTEPIDDAPTGDEQGATEEQSAERSLERLHADLAEMEDKWKRALAETQNVRRQSRLNESEAMFQGQKRVLEGVIPVLDHFDLALGQDPATVSAEQIIGGVRLIRDELLKALASHNVSLVEPKPGDEFDPMRHEAMMRQPAGDVAPGHIVQVLQVGYAMGDRVLRPAKVTLAEEASGEG